MSLPDSKAALFPLDSDALFFNHGSFGLSPTSVLAAADKERQALQRQPVAFMRQVPKRLAQVRQRWADFVGADRNCMWMATNTTTGICAILRHLQLQPGARVVCTDHTYDGVWQALAMLKRSGVQLTTVQTDVWMDDDRLCERIDAATDGASVLLIDQIASVTGAILPLERIIQAAKAKGVTVVVDGAHAPGQVVVNLESLGADYWVGNLHKWGYAPMPCAVVYAADGQLTPLVWGLGATNHPDAHHWPGSRDPSSWLAAAAALDFIEEHGFAHLMQHRASVAHQIEHQMEQAFGDSAIIPATHRASLLLWAHPVLPDGADKDDHQAFMRHAWETQRLEIYSKPLLGRALLRISAQIYHGPEQIAGLVTALKRLQA